MKLNCFLACILALPVFASQVDAQRVFCINGQCRRVFPAPVVRQPILSQQIIVQQPAIQSTIPINTIVLNPLQEEVLVEASQLEAFWNTNNEDRFDQVIRATVRVTVSGVCGSGTVVGRDGQGNALVLTNAHVAGTSRGRIVNVERWDTNGNSERGTGTIIAAGYGRGMSVDFALLKCSSGFAKDVTPIPLADRFPDTNVTVTNYGSPRCEWPSLQVLKVNRAEGQVLSWKPEAIGGRSGSSVIDHTDVGPRVVGLLTWAGGGEGLGQSTPFLLDAMRGQLPATLEALPPGTREVGCQDENQRALFQVPATTSGLPLNWPAGSLAQTSVQDDLIDSIIERPKPKPPIPEQPVDPPAKPAEPSEPTWSPTAIATASAMSSVLLLLGLQYGVPLLFQVIRQFRTSRGDSTLTDDQFQQLLLQYRDLLGRLDLIERSVQIKKE